MIRFTFAALVIGTLACTPVVRAQPAPPALHDGAHDFDFELGAWTAHIERRLHPLAGDDTWIELDGTSTVRPIWGGAANLGELDVAGGGAHIQGMSLRVYDPQAHQWRIYWANRKDGALGTPMVGGFDGAGGAFYDQETFAGRAIYVRFLFTPVVAGSFRIEQAFSADGGTTWEANWIATFTRA